MTCVTLALFGAGMVRDATRVGLRACTCGLMMHGCMVLFMLGLCVFVAGVVFDADLV